MRTWDAAQWPYGDLKRRLGRLFYGQTCFHWPRHRSQRGRFACRKSTAGKVQNEDKPKANLAEPSTLPSSSHFMDMGLKLLLARFGRVDMVGEDTNADATVWSPPAVACSLNVHARARRAHYASIPISVHIGGLYALNAVD